MEKSIHILNNLSIYPPVLLEMNNLSFMSREYHFMHFDMPNFAFVSCNLDRPFHSKTTTTTATTQLLTE